MTPDELGPDARALLDAAREGLSPDPAAIRRVHGRIHAAAAGAAATGTAIGLTLGVAGVIAAIAIGGGVYLQRGRSAAPASPPSLELASPVERPERAAAHEPAPPSDEDLITIETPRPNPTQAGPRGAPAGSRPVPAARAAQSTAAPVAAPASPAHATAIDLGREVELVDIAMAALRRGDAAAALRVMQEYAAEAGSAGGQLAQDAAAIEIEALCKLGDPAARDKRAAFDARFPHSAQRARLAAACR